MIGFVDADRFAITGISNFSTSIGTIIFFMGFMVIAIDSFSGWLRRSLMPDRKQLKSS